jgi:hypothetical protein
MEIALEPENCLFLWQEIMMADHLASVKISVAVASSEERT